MLKLYRIAALHNEEIHRFDVTAESKTEARGFVIKHWSYEQIKAKVINIVELGEVDSMEGVAYIDRGLQ